MTEQEIASLGPAFASYLGRFRICFGQKRTAAHFDTYCRGLLSDLPRKSVEPIALEAGTAVRTLRGTAPIETLRVGDQVLTMNLKSGALGFHPVVVVHHNPPSKTFRITLAGETIVSSPFHRELYGPWRTQTHGDWIKADMDVYRRALRGSG